MVEIKQETISYSQKFDQLIQKNLKFLKYFPDASFERILRIKINYERILA
jgi:hypothetical protein